MDWFDIAKVAHFAKMHDAADHMEHYLRNSGEDFVIDLDGLIAETMGGKLAYYRELNEAMTLAETVKGSWNFEVMSREWSHGTTPKADSWNWYYATHGFSVYGSGPGRVIVPGSEFELHFHFYFYDPYNWNAGEGVTILGKTVADVTLGRLHQVGIAQEFDLVGHTMRTVRWKAGERFDPMTGKLVKQDPVMQTSIAPRR